MNEMAGKGELKTSGSMGLGMNERFWSFIGHSDFLRYKEE